MVITHTSTLAHASTRLLPKSPLIMKGIAEERGGGNRAPVVITHTVALLLALFGQILLSLFMLNKQDS
jgi:hypothetical protein